MPAQIQIKLSQCLSLHTRYSNRKDPYYCKRLASTTLFPVYPRTSPWPGG